MEAVGEVDVLPEEAAAVAGFVHPIAQAVVVVDELRAVEADAELVVVPRRLTGHQADAGRLAEGDVAASLRERAPLVGDQPLDVRHELDVVVAHVVRDDEKHVRWAGTAFGARTGRGAGLRGRPRVAGREQRAGAREREPGHTETLECLAPGQSPVFARRLHVRMLPQRMWTANRSRASRRATISVSCRCSIPLPQRHGCVRGRPGLRDAVAYRLRAGVGQGPRGSRRAAARHGPTDPRARPTRVEPHTAGSGGSLTDEE